jgi:hypothetical protein
VLAVALGVVAAAVVSATLAIRIFSPTADTAALRPTTGSVVPVEQGLTFDAKDLPTVMANTDSVFVGTVLAVAGRDEDAAWTTFTVTVLETVAGRLPDEAEVRQHGFVDRQGTVHIVEDQALVEVGRTYVFAANHEPSLGVYTVAPGPWAARPTETGGQRALVKQYKEAR